MRRWASAIEDAGQWCEESGDVELTPQLLEMRAQAECVIVGTDIRNAFGCMFRSSAIATVARCCPQLAGLLAASWCRGTKLWARVSDTEWVSRTSDRGGTQGRLSTQVAFCAHLHEVMSSVAGLQPPERGAGGDH